MSHYLVNSPPPRHWWQRGWQWLFGEVKSKRNLMMAQVSDMHIGPTDTPYRGISSRQQLVAVLQILAKKPLDLLILSGDLAADTGEIESYRWLQQVLNDFPWPYLLMAGNHDHLGRLTEVFNLPSNDIVANQLCFSRTLDGKRLLFLDSSSYRVPTSQLDWLRQQLAEETEEVLLFIHHPPLLCGCRFMDEQYYLKNYEEVWSVLQTLPPIKHIFCGHYHTDKKIIEEDKTVYLTPATVFQIDTQAAEFMIQHTHPGWRIIEWNGKQLRTYVEYL